MGLFEATGIYQRCLGNTHTEFLAYDKVFITDEVLHHSTPRVKMNADFFYNEAIERVVEYLMESIFVCGNFFIV